MVMPKVRTWGSPNPSLGLSLGLGLCPLRKSSKTTRPGQIRTDDQGIMSPLLLPLSYGPEGRPILPHRGRVHGTGASFIRGGMSSWRPSKIAMSTWNGRLETVSSPANG